MLTGVEYEGISGDCDSTAFDETIEQITKVQIWLKRYMLKESIKRSPDYIPPPGFFAVRNMDEGLRTTKRRLGREKNRRLNVILTTSSKIPN